MQTASKNSQPDYRRALTCAALATITSLGMFSLVANLMTPMFAGIQLLAREPAAQQTPSIGFEDTVCVQTAHTDDTESRRSVI
jgi:hypothetical protein